MEMSAEHKVLITSPDGFTLDARILKVDSSRAAVLLVHGFGVDLHEEGTFDVLVERLADSCFSEMRFSFRGHGSSSGKQEETTISGERLDLFAAYEMMVNQLNPPYAIVAASFGAVSTLLELERLRPKPTCLVLWNPVLDIQSVFVHPITPWGKQNFGQRAFDVAAQQGHTVVDGVFRAGQLLLKEMQLYSGNIGLSHLQSISTLILHGTADTYVPFESSKTVASLSNVRLVEVTGSDHGFPKPDDENRVLSETVAWINTHLGLDSDGHD